MAKSSKKKRPPPRDPLIARARKTPEPVKPRKAKDHRDRPEHRSAAASAGPAVSRAPAPLAHGPPVAVLDRLFDVVTSRRTADPAVSHSARLLARGAAKVAQKFGEEAVECLIEAVAGNRDALIAESADVLYHLIVLWVSAGVTPSEVWEELTRREGISGIAEKAARVKMLPVAFGPGTTKIP